METKKMSRLEKQNKLNYIVSTNKQENNSWFRYVLLHFYADIVNFISCGKFYVHTRPFEINTF